MVSIDDMTTKRWVNLLKAAGVTSLDDIDFVVSEGPIVIQSKDRCIVNLDSKHYQNLESKWEKIKEKFNG